MNWTAVRARTPGVDADAVAAAVGQVLDPEIRRPIGELGMIAGVVPARRGAVEVTIRLTTASCPLSGRIRDEVTAAASRVPGVDAVTVSFTEMSPRQRADLAASLRADAPSLTGGLGARPRIYAVASGKGGVGKSSVTANLAVALAMAGGKVGVLDADVWGYSIPQLFGVRQSPVTVGGLMMPVQAHGVSLMSMGFLVPDGQPVVWRGPMLHKALEQFLVDVHWGELDTLLLDLPPGTGDIQLSLLELVPDAALLAVTTPQPAARGVATRVVRMARDAGMPVAGIVENMSATVCSGCGAVESVFGSGGGAELAAEAGAPLLGQIPLDLALREAGDAGVPVVLSRADAPSARALESLARRLPDTRRSLVGRALPLFPVRAAGG